jgi:hypothetical protein
VTTAGALTPFAGAPGQAGSVDSPEVIDGEPYNSINN